MVPFITTFPAFSASLLLFPPSLLWSDSLTMFLERGCAHFQVQEKSCQDSFPKILKVIKKHFPDSPWKYDQWKTNGTKERFLKMKYWHCWRGSYVVLVHQIFHGIQKGLFEQYRCEFHFLHRFIHCTFDFWCKKTLHFLIN